MIVLLDTSTPTCRLTIVHENERFEHEWEAGRSLARGLLNFINTNLVALGASMQQISGVGVMRGPGSFTGLRIGLTVANTLADSLNIPIVGELGEVWQSVALERLGSGADDQIVLPLYASDAHITKPRK